MIGLKTGYGEAIELSSKTLTKVNSRGLNSRFVIALHSPFLLLQTGLHMRAAEKAGTVTPFSAKQSVLCSPVRRGIIAKYGHFSHISQQKA